MTGAVEILSLTKQTLWMPSYTLSGVNLGAVSGSGNSKIRVFVTANTPINADDVMVNILAQNGAKATLQISRAGAEPIFSISPTNNSVDADGGVVVLSISTNMLWTASANQSWVTLNSSSGSGNSNISVFVTEITSINADELMVTMHSLNGARLRYIVAGRAVNLVSG